MDSKLDTTPRKKKTASSTAAVKTEKVVKPAAAKVAGVATLPADNEHGAAGAIRAEVEAGEHKFKNGGDVTVASVGATAYMADAHSVVLDAGTAPTLKPVAGTIVQVDDDGVWVRIGV